MLRWIDPDIWGFYAWSVLFAIANRVQKSDTIIMVRHAWFKLARLLPEILPCHTCRCCCAKFIKQSPPENSSPTKWLYQLRQQIQTRNLNSPDCNKLDKSIHLTTTSTTSTTFTTEDYERTLKRFGKREELVQLWLMDVVMFLACVAMTLDLVQQIQTWTDFATLLLALIPINLQLLPPTTGDNSLPRIIQWLSSSPIAPNPTAFTATLDTITVKSRQIKSTLKT